MKTAQLTCPHCQAMTDHSVPSNASVIAYDCKGCHKEVVAKEDSCCVVCDYSEGTCPVKSGQSDDEVSHA